MQVQIYRKSPEVPILRNTSGLAHRSEKYLVFSFLSYFDFYRTIDRLNVSAILHSVGTDMPFIPSVISEQNSDVISCSPANCSHVKPENSRC